MTRRSLRVPLLSANTERSPDPVFPLGAACMAAVAEREGHAVATLDLCFVDTPARVVSDALRTFDPEVIGISLRNLDSATYPEQHSYVDDYRGLVAGLRASSNAPIVLGGSGFTVMPTTSMEFVNADVGVEGALMEGIEAYGFEHSNRIVPGKSIRTDTEGLRRLRARKIKGQLGRLLR